MAAEDASAARLTYDAIVLAGGGARRLGGVDKPMLRIAGRTLLERAIDACEGARATVVVGPRRSLPVAVTWAQERPAGAGPLAALVAGLDALPRPWPQAVVLLAGDLVGVGKEDVQLLLDRLASQAGAGGRGGQAPARVRAAVGVDGDGRWQPLLGAYDPIALDHTLALAGDPANRPVRWLPDRLDAVAVPLPSSATADIDTPADLEAIVLEGWVQQLSAELGVDPADFEVSTLLDVARDAAHHVARPAAPVTTFLIGYAAASRGGGAGAVQQCVELAQRLALAQPPVDPGTV